jgi:hypothetical protein
VGANFTAISLTGRTVDVQPFHQAYEPTKGVPIVTAATCLVTDDGQTFILIVHEALWFGAAMKYSLLNPNQLRMNGVEVWDNPLQNPFGILAEGLFIPFDSSGTILCFTTFAPTAEEIETYPHIILTEDEPWEPYLINMRNGIREDDNFAPGGSTSGTSEVWSVTVVPETEAHLVQISSVYSEKALAQAAKSTMLIEDIQMAEGPQIPGTGVRTTALVSEKRHEPALAAELLARKWNIGLNTAKDTLRVTTQEGIRHAVHPIHRRYRTDHLHLHRNKLNTTFYTDTLFSKYKSLEGNKAAQVFTDGRFTFVVPLASKTGTEVGRALQEFIDDVGVPDMLVCDLAGEQYGKHTDFVKFARRAHIKLHYAEMGHHNQNAQAEQEIGHLKRRWKTTMVNKNIPGRLWDFALVYQGHLLSRIA